jgi:hypothetical protein
MRALRNANSDNAFVGVKEAVDPVNLSAFTNITGNMIFEAALASYTAPEFIGNELVTEEKSTRDGGFDTGLAPIDDDAMIVKEGEEFPSVKFGEDYIKIPTSVKRGLKIGITRELVFFDQTGKIIEQAQTIGGRLGTNKEKRILRTVLGIDNGFERKGVARNTYVLTGGGDPRVNAKASTTLTDYTSIDTAMQLFADMNDDRAVGEPISVMPDTMLIPWGLQWTAKRILNATELRVVTNTTNTAITPNIVPGMRVISSPWIGNLLVAAGSTAANAAKYWYLGQFKKAFKYRTLFPFQVKAAQHDKDDFERDVIAQFRADERGVPRIVAPWYAAKFYDVA